MALLSPALLWLLAVGPILLFFYVWRARHKRFVAPSVLLWQRALQETEHRASWRLPIRHILLLLELLALALLGFSLARPAVSVGVPHQQVIVLDASLQMTARDSAAGSPKGTSIPRGIPMGGPGTAQITRFAAAQAAIGQMIDHLGPADTMSLIRVGAVAQLVLTSGDRQALRAAVAQQRPDLGAPAMADGLLLARQVAALSHGAQPSLTVLTARSMAGGATPPQANYCDAVQRWPAGSCRVLRLGTSDDDQAVTDLAASCPAAAARGGSPGGTAIPRGGPSGDCSVFARIVNYGPQGVTEPVALYADGLPLPLPAQDSTYFVPARSSLDLVFSAPRQAHTVELALGHHDIISGDDRRWAVLPHPRMSTVLIVSDEPSLLDRAVHAIPDVSVTDVTPDQYTDAAALGADATIFDSWLPDTPAPSNALILNPPQGSSYLPYDHMMRDPAVATIDDRTTLAQTLLGGVDLRALVVGSAPALRLPEWAQALVASNEGPLIMAGTRAPDPGTSSTGTGTAPRLIVVGFGIVAPSSNLSQLVAFPLLLERAIAWLAGVSSGDPGGATGDQVAITSPAWGTARPLEAEPAGSVVTVLDPAMKRVALAASPVDGSPIFVAGGAPGAYVVRQGAGAASAEEHIAVNPATGGAGAAGGQQAGLLAPAAAGASGAIARLVARQEIWWALVLAVLAVLSVEWWVYAKRT
jgi:hypothetical protein